jgi:hypothetical protein
MDAREEKVSGGIDQLAEAAGIPNPEEPQPDHATAVGDLELSIACAE